MRVNSMKVSAVSGDASSRAAATRRDAFGIVVLASIVWATAGIEYSWVLLLAFFLPDVALACSLLVKRIGSRLVVESQVALYPAVLVVLGMAGRDGALGEVLLSVGAGWLVRIGVQRLVGRDLRSNTP